MTEKICPVCNRSNLPTATRCWYCQSLLEDEPTSSGTESAAPGPAAEAGKGEGDVPEWLARIRARKAIENMEPAAKPESEENQSEPQEPPAEEKVASEPRQPGIDLPAWITDLGKESESTPEVSEPLPPKADEGAGNTDWLKKLTAWQAEEEPEPAAPAEAEAEKAQGIPPADNTPEWLAEFLAPDAAPEPGSAVESVEPFDEGALPVALPGETRVLPEGSGSTGEAAQDEAYDFSQEEETTSPEEDQIPAVDESELEAGFTPLSVELPAEPAVEPPDVVKEAAHQNGTDLDWLTDYYEPVVEEPAKTAQDAPPEKPDTQPLTPFLGVQENDWAAQPVEPEEKAGEETPEKDMEPPAASADWMEKLRPVDSGPLVGNVTPLVSLTKEGPLAGIRGALQGAELPDIYSKPPIYTNKVQVTDRQALRADLLSNLLEEKAPEEVVVEAKAPVRRRLLKILVGVLLLTVVFGVLVAAPGTSLLPVLYPPETANAYTLINGLGSDTPVLIAADFEAGLSGEIGFTSQSVMEHLMLRDVPLAVFSSNPVGSVLINEMLSSAQSKVGAYDLASRTVQLGYLAGGSVGLQALAVNVRTALPYTIDLFPAWDAGLLQNTHALSDFGALVVLTDDADTGRYWVEQVQPALAGIPLILVTSAQAAPMLLPYYESGQISGVIAGISGGSAYEQLLQLPGNSTYYFGAYQVLVLAVILLILISGVVSLVRPEANGRKA